MVWTKSGYKGKGIKTLRSDLSPSVLSFTNDSRTYKRKLPNMLARILAVAFLPAAVLSSVIAPESISAFCQSPTVVSELFIGEQKNVKVEAISCANEVTDVVHLEKRQAPVNVCGAQCRCFTYM